MQQVASRNCFEDIPTKTKACNSTQKYLRAASAYRDAETQHPTDTVMFMCSDSHTPHTAGYDS